MKAINIILMAAIFSLAIFVSPRIGARQIITMHNQSIEVAYQKPTIVLYGDDSTENNPVPLKLLTVIAQSDMESLWSALGIDTSVWPPLSPSSANETNFPMIYAAQGYIAFEREYTSVELDELITECESASTVVQTEGAKRALTRITMAAKLEKDHQGRLLFRPGMCSPDVDERKGCPK